MPLTARSLHIAHLGWMPVGGDALRVELHGRWADELPSEAVTAVLCVDEGRRRVRRFPAAETRAAGAGALWIAVFLVPRELGPKLAGGVTLELGPTRIPLPAPTAGPPPDTGPPPEASPPETPEATDAEEPSTVVEPGVLAERRVRRVSLVDDTGERAPGSDPGAAGLALDLARAEARLEEAEGERGRLEALLTERERALVAARQRAFAEERLRYEALEADSDRLRTAEAEAAAVASRLRRAEDRIAELEAELARLQGAAAGEPDADAARGAARGAAGRHRKAGRGRACGGVRGGRCGSRGAHPDGDRRGARVAVAGAGRDAIAARSHLCARRCRWPASRQGRRLLAGARR